MRAALYLMTLIFVLGGCSEQSTATGPDDAPKASPSPAPAAAPPAAASPAAEAAASPATEAAAAPPKEETAEDAKKAAPVSVSADDDDDSSAAAAKGATATESSPESKVAGGKETDCSDRLDNDQDRAVDCDDTDCWSDPDCESPDEGAWVEQGPGPNLGSEGEQAPGPEGTDGGPRMPEDDGIGVACADYIACVCGVAEAEAGRVIDGYSHTVACEKTSSLVGNQVEEYCGKELDKLKEILQGASEGYAAAKITLPASCN